MAPIISVRDPEEKDREISDDEKNILEIGIARRHVGALLRGLGYHELSSLLFDATETFQAQRSESAISKARELATQLRKRELKTPTTVPALQDTLVGGFVTQAGLVTPGDEVTETDAAVLARIGLRPSFVGIESQVLAAVIDGDVEKIATLRVDRDKKRPPPLSDREDEDDNPREDGAGTWLIRLDRDKASIA